MGKTGRFGEYGGQYVPEIVMNAVNELNEAYEKYKNDPDFLKELHHYYRESVSYTHLTLPTTSRV